MSKKYKDYEKHMAKAVGAWDSYVGRSIRTLAKEFDVSRPALTKQFYEEASRPARPSTNRALTDEQEKAVCDYTPRSCGLDT